MRGLVLQAHPSRDSYNEALLERTVAGLSASGVEAEVHRLYEGADPGPDQLAEAELVAFVYPTWWGGLPGTVLDWLQRRLGPTLDHDAPSPFAAVERLIVVTSHGSSRWVNVLQGEPGKQLMMRDVVGACAPDVRSRWISLYRLDRRSPNDLTAHLRRVESDVAAAAR